jgi:hypothetical protein
MHRVPEAAMPHCASQEILLRNPAIPILTIAALDVANLLGGANLFGDAVGDRLDPACCDRSTTKLLSTVSRHLNYVSFCTLRSYIEVFW